MSITVMIEIMDDHEEESFGEKDNTGSSEE
jgi:hypothetical protein